jgi:RimJ/RimL family protein N-acetyltransferase
MELHFARMQTSDLPFFLEVRNLVRNQLHDSREFSLSEAESWFAVTPNEYWLIFCEEIPVGYFRISKENIDSWQIGADIHPNFQRKGIATKAYHEFIDEIIRSDSNPPMRLELRVLKTNPIAFQLYKNLGFTAVDDSENDITMLLLI